MLRGYLYICLIDTKIPWQFETALIRIPFIWLSYIYKKYDRLFEIIETKFWIYPTTCAVYIIAVLSINNDVNIYSERFGYFPLFMVSAVVGIYELVMICRKVCKVKISNVIRKFILLVDMTTMVYYAFQSKVIKAIRILADKVSVNREGYVMSIVSMAVVYCLLAISTFIVGRYFPFLIGRAKKERKAE